MVPFISKGIVNIMGNNYVDAPDRSPTLRRFKLTTLNELLSVYYDGHAEQAQVDQWFRFVQYGKVYQIRLIHRRNRHQSKENKSNMILIVFIKLLNVFLCCFL